MDNFLWWIGWTDHNAQEERRLELEAIENLKLELEQDKIRANEVCVCCVYLCCVRWIVIFPGHSVRINHEKKLGTYNQHCVHFFVDRGSPVMGFPVPRLTTGGTGGGVVRGG